MGNSVLHVVSVGEHKGLVHPKRKTDYPLTPMQMERQVTFYIPQNISGALQENRVGAFKQLKKCFLSQILWHDNDTFLNPNWVYWILIRILNTCNNYFLNCTTCFDCYCQHKLRYQIFLLYFTVRCSVSCEIKIFMAIICFHWVPLKYLWHF